MNTQALCTCIKSIRFRESNSLEAPAIATVRFDTGIMLHGLINSALKATFRYVTFVY